MILLMSVLLSMSFGSSVAYDITKCGLIYPDPNLNLTWFKDVQKWYIPVWWDYGTYIYYVKFLMGEETYNNMTTEQKALSCDIFSSYGGPEVSVTSYGVVHKFGFAPHFNPVRPGVMDWISNGRFAGTSYVLLTDNKSFIVGLDQYAIGYSGMWAASPRNKLYPSEVAYIVRKMKQMGWKQQQLFLYDYSPCNV